VLLEQIHGSILPLCPFALIRNTQLASINTSFQFYPVEGIVHPALDALNQPTIFPVFRESLPVSSIDYTK
jgi:hypothetical protein